MKKLIIFVIIFLFSPIFTFADEVKTLDLMRGSSYLLLLEDEAVDFNSSNPEVMNFQAINTLENDKQQIILQAVNFGTTNFEIKTPSILYKYKFNIVQLANPLAENLFEIEEPKGNR